MKNYQFGADYYPEHWPEQRWPMDAKLMKELGLKVVRMAEFSWHKMEPEEGHFDFEWLDRAIDILRKEGIVSVLGTPSAAPPAWMIRKHPKIQPVGPDGIIRGFGGRHHDCQSNPVYREYVKKMVTAMAEHFKDNPGVVGWQIDNEFGNSHYNLCMCDSCKASFQKWLAKKYGTIEELNKAWGTYFWSQEYNDFSEVFPPVKTPCGANPSQVLDWKRFHSDLICDFSKVQTDIIRSIVPKEHFITHNCMGFSDIVSYYDLSKQLDFVCHDLYPFGYWRDHSLEPFEIGVELDGIRGVCKAPFWIMEQQSSVTGWEIMGRKPAPGQIPLWAVDSVAHGADTVVFFRWRSCLGGTEQYWHGILPHSGIPGKTYEEIGRLINDMTPVMKDMEGAMPTAQVAIVRSYEQGWAFDMQPNVQGLNYYGQLIKYYKAFHHKNIPVDFVREDDDISGYKVVIAPLQYLADQDLAAHYEEYVKQGGNLVLTMRAGVKERNNLCYAEGPLPGVFSGLLGITVEEYDPLGSAFVPVKGVSGSEDNRDASDDTCSKTAGDGLCAAKWADIITLKGAEPVFDYDGEYYEGTPAVTVNSLGEGKAWYVGCEPSESLMEAIVDMLAKETGTGSVEGSDIKVPAGVEVTSREKNGRKWIFILNHTDEEKKTDISDRFRVLSGALKDNKLQPYGYAVLEG